MHGPEISARSSRKQWQVGRPKGRPDERRVLSQAIYLRYCGWIEL